MFQGFICYATGEEKTPADCLACSRAGGQLNAEGSLCPFTPPLVKGLSESNLPRELPAYSATEVLGCLRQVVLRDQEPYYIQPARAYWAFRGKLAHGILEYAAQDEPDVMLETRFYAELAGQLFTGQIDLFYPGRGHLVDYKTTKAVPESIKQYICPACQSVMRADRYRYRKGTKATCGACGAVHQANDLAPEILPPQPYSSHTAQLNAYAWLLAQAGYSVQTAEIVYLDMSEVLRVPVELWDLETTQAYLEARMQEFEILDLAGLPEGVQGNADEEWRCNYCPVFAACQRATQEAEALQHALTQRDLAAEAEAVLYPEVVV